jgi:hypothetical protein
VFVKCLNIKLKHEIHFVLSFFNPFFQAIESRLLSTQLTLDLVMIENILSYYFEDISTGLVSIGKYVSRLLHQSVLKYLRKFNLALIYTKYIPPGRGNMNLLLILIT